MADENPSEREETQRERLDRELTIAGLACLALAMNGAVLLVTDLLFRETTVTVTVALTAALFIGLWFALGLARRTVGQPSH